MKKKQKQTKNKQTNKQTNQKPKTKNKQTKKTPNVILLFFGVAFWTHASHKKVFVQFPSILAFVSSGKGLFPGDWV